MRGTLAYISLLLFNASFIRTALTRPSVVSDSSISLIQTTGQTPDPPSDASSSSSNFCQRKSNSQLSAGGEIVAKHIQIPGTTIGLTVSYCTGLPMDKELIRDTVTIAWNHLNDQYLIHGDSPLLSDDDPYNVPVSPGKNSEMQIKSSKIPETQTIPTHLTYRIALNALSGLFEYLYTGGHAGAAFTEVFDPTRSNQRLGMITISPKWDEES